MAHGTGVIGGALITALVAVVPAAAEAQTYAITVDSGTHFLKASVSEVGCSSEYRSDSEYKPISFSGAFYVLPELPLHFSDGKWLPATASYTGIGSIGTADSNSTITTTLSAGGIVTGSEFGSIAGLAPGTIMGSSTLDLNTGAFTFARTITRTGHEFTVPYRHHRDSGSTRRSPDSKDTRSPALAANHSHESVRRVRPHAARPDGRDGSRRVECTGRARACGRWRDGGGRRLSEHSASTGLVQPDRAKSGHRVLRHWQSRTVRSSGTYRRSRRRAVRRR